MVSFHVIVKVWNQLSKLNFTSDGDKTLSRDEALDVEEDLSTAIDQVNNLAYF